MGPTPWHWKLRKPIARIAWAVYCWADFVPKGWGVMPPETTEDEQ